MVDVVRFGARYCSQRPEVHALLGRVVAEHMSRPYASRAARLAAVTRSLRQAGLIVATRTQIRRRAPRDHGSPLDRATREGRS
jgi:hypothetical protein